MVNQCVLRRTCGILSQYLPVEIEQIVYCSLAAAQTAVYRAVLASKTVTSVIGLQEGQRTSASQKAAFGASLLTLSF